MGDLKRYCEHYDETVSEAWLLSNCRQCADAIRADGAEDLFMAAIMSGTEADLEESEEDQAETLTVPRSEPRSAETPSITDDEQAELLQADQRKEVTGTHKGHQYRIIPAFNRFGDPEWWLKCRQGYDNNKDWEGGWAALDTLDAAIKHAAWRINGEVERAAPAVTEEFQGSLFA